MEFYKGMQITYMGQYPAVYLPSHHKAIATNGCVYVHNLVAEDILQRPLKEQECVHHVDENKSNFAKENIWVFNSSQDHALYHACLKYQKDFILIKRQGIYYCYSEQYYLEKFNSMLTKQFEKTKRSVCPICGKVMTTKAKLCLDCYKKKNSQHIPSAEQLLKDYRETPNFSALGNKYNVSYTAIKKWFKHYNLPYKTKELEQYIVVNKL